MKRAIDTPASSALDALRTHKPRQDAPRIALTVRHDFSEKHAPNGRWPKGGWQRAEMNALEIAQHLAAGNIIAVAAFSADQRAARDFVSAQLIGLDFDGTAVRDVVKHGVLHSHAFYVYPTPSDGKDGVPRSRAMLMLDEPITDASEYVRLVMRLHQHIASIQPDEACRDAARVFYGSRKPGAEFMHCQPLPVAWLRALPAHPAEHPADADRDIEIVQASQLSAPTKIHSPATDARAARYIASALASIASTLPAAAEGTRNRTLFIAAARLGNLAAAAWNALTRADAEAFLIQNAPGGLPVREVQETIRSGLNTGMLTPADAPAWHSAERADASAVRGMVFASGWMPAGLRAAFCRADMRSAGWIVEAVSLAAAGGALDADAFTAEELRAFTGGKRDSVYRALNAFVRMHSEFQCSIFAIQRETGAAGDAPPLESISLCTETPNTSRKRAGTRVFRMPTPAEFIPLVMHRLAIVEGERAARRCKVNLPAAALDWGMPVSDGDLLALNMPPADEARIQRARESAAAALDAWSARIRNTAIMPLPADCPLSSASAWQVAIARAVGLAAAETSAALPAGVIADHVGCSRNRSPEMMRRAGFQPDMPTLTEFTTSQPREVFRQARRRGQIVSIKTPTMPAQPFTLEAHALATAAGMPVTYTLREQRYTLAGAARPHVRKPAGLTPTRRKHAERLPRRNAAGYSRRWVGAQLMMRVAGVDAVPLAAEAAWYRLADELTATAERMRELFTAASLAERMRVPSMADALRDVSPAWQPVPTLAEMAARAGLPYPPIADYP